LELRYSPTHFACGKGFPEEEVIRWIQGAIDRAVDAYDIEVVPVVTISRNYGIELAENTVKIAAKYAGRFFFGFDFAGDEINFPAASMAYLFRMAKDAGLGLTIHAGEAGGPENVIEAVEEFDSDRIGHGIQAARSEAAMALLKEKKVMLEICPTSNLHTGVVDSLENHPVKTFYKRDIPVSLNTDDPMISNITLTDEYTNALEKMGFDENDLKRFNLMALDHSFHPDKKSLKERLSHLWH
jgi:adenosine deaminase